MGELYVYTGSAWKQANQFYVYTGSAWKEATEGYIYTGSAWKQFWPTAFPALVAVDQNIGSNGNGCAVGKCVRCVEWEAENASDASHHIRVTRSVSGGGYFEVADDLSIDRRCGSLDTCGDSGCSGGVSFDLLGCFCDAGCQSTGTSTQFRIMLEIDGTDTLAGPLNCELTTNSLSTCGTEA